MGSPPLARGPLEEKRPRKALTGITPARAGTTCILNMQDGVG